MEVESAIFASRELAWFRVDANLARRVARHAIALLHANACLCCATLNQDFYTTNLTTQ